jgi:chromatin remodeling complex protein RSC6
MAQNNTDVVDTESKNMVLLRSQFQKLLSDLSKIKLQITQVQNSTRSIEKNVKKEIRSLERKLGKTKNKPVRKPSGFAVPTKISKELCNFMNVEEGVKMARTEVTQYIISYIKTKKLQDSNNGRKIKPDKALKSLLNVKKNQDLTYFNLQKYMNKHFVKEA